MVDVGDTQIDFSVERVDYRCRWRVDVVKIDGVYPLLGRRRPEVIIPLVIPVFSVRRGYLQRRVNDLSGNFSRCLFLEYLRRQCRYYLFHPIANVEPSTIRWIDGSNQRLGSSIERSCGLPLIIFIDAAFSGDI